MDNMGFVNVEFITISGSTSPLLMATGAKKCRKSWDNLPLPQLVSLPDFWLPSTVC